MKKASGWLWGLVLVALGVILGINALGIAHINIFFSGWWTLFIIVPSLIGLITEKRKGGAFAGLVIGVCLLLACLDIVPFDLMWKLLLPIILVMVGVIVILHSMTDGEVADKINHARRKQAEERRKTRHIAEAEVVTEEDEDDYDEDGDVEAQAYWSTFGDQKIDYDEKEFSGCKLDAVFGGVDLDLRHAKIKDEAIVRASAVFGGIIIYVPEDLNVEIASSSIFGGTSDKRKQSAKAKPKKTLYIDSTCVFGGVEIR